MTAAVTDRADVAFTPFIEAVMVVLPAETPVTWPLGLTVATAVVDDVQLTCVLRSEVLPSLKVPVAVSCSVSFVAIAGLGAAMAIDFRVAVVCAPVDELGLATRLALHPARTKMDDNARR